MLMVVRNLFRFFPEQQGGKPAENPPAEKPSEQKPKEESGNVELAKALKEARENSVPKSDYEKLLEENKKLVSEIINGGADAGSGQQDAPKKDPDKAISELRNELYGPNCSELSNLEYWTKTLELRKAVIEKGEPDPFLPVGAKISPDEDDVEKANNVADVVEQCIKEADGNSEVFTALLQSRTNNDSPQMVMRLKKLGIKF